MRKHLGLAAATALAVFVVGPEPAAASPLPSFVQATQETVKVVEREDHSPFLLKTPAGAPALVWVATAPDTNIAGRFDEVAYADRAGGSWGTPVIVGGPAPAIFTPEVAFDSDGGRWISWAEHDGTDSKIRLRRDLGVDTWNFTLDDPTQPDLEASMCADDSGGVVVVWQGWRGDNYEILFATGDENGFSAAQVISTCPLSDREPEVVWGAGQAWIVWSSYQNPAYNLISRRFDGVSLSAPVTLTTSYRARNLHPQIAWDDVHGALWFAFEWVNQGWEGFNQHEFPGLYDPGSPRVRAYDGTSVFVPSGLDANSRFPLTNMEGLGYSRYINSGVPTPDRFGEGVFALPLPNGSVEVLHRQYGSIVELGASNFYWSVTGVNYGNGAWSSPTEFLELRASFAWEEPTALAAEDAMWVAWTADRRTPPIAPGNLNANLFGADANIVVRGVPVDTTNVGPISLVNLGPASAPPSVSPIPRPQFTIEDSTGTRTLVWGDNHRHSVDLSWDGYADPGIKQTLFYGLDWLGFDFLSTSDHAERFSKAVWAAVARWSMMYDIPSRFRLFPGYERSMRAGDGGGDQNSMYRDPMLFTEASAAYPENDDWHLMYDAQAGRDVLSVPNQMPQCFAVTKWQELAEGHPDSLDAPLRLVEVYQALRKSFEYAGCPDQTTFCTVNPDTGWVNVALAMGLRLGLICASDHTIVAGYMGALTESMSRDDIWQALYDRHCLGASKNGKMNVDFRVGGNLMGSEAEMNAAPTIFIHVQSASPLSFLEVNKNGNPTWFAATSSAAETTITFVDPDPVVAGTSSYYYLRTRDSAGRITWSSPVWIDFEEPPVGTDAPVVSGPQEEFSIRVGPNPSTGPVRFALRGLAASGGVVRIHDLGGRLVRELTLASGAPTREVVWDARDAQGSAVAAGFYYAVARSGGAIRSEKIAVLR